jgi:ankyrin repeat protein
MGGLVYTDRVNYFLGVDLDKYDCRRNLGSERRQCVRGFKAGLALLSLGADATVKNHVGATSLHMICRLGSTWQYNEESGRRYVQHNLVIPWALEIPRLSLQRRMKKRVPWKAQNHHDFVQKLCKAGDIYALDEAGNSALHWACID